MVAKTGKIRLDEVRYRREMGRATHTANEQHSGANQDFLLVQGKLSIHDAVKDYSGSALDYKGRKLN